MSELLIRERSRWFSRRLVERTALFIGWVTLMVASAAGYWGREDWRLELFVNFRMQYYLVALLLCGVAAWRGYHGLLGLFLIVFIWNGWEIFDLAPPRSKPVAGVYRAISANVYTKNSQPNRTEAWIREQEPDFVALIEIDHKWDPVLERLRDILPYQRHQAWGAHYGAAILSRFPPTRQPRDYPYAGVGSVPLEVQTPDGRLHLLLVHPLAPMNERAWKWRGKALEAIAKYTAIQSETTPVIALGDWNTTPWSGFYADFVKASNLAPVETSALPRRTWPTHNPLAWIPIDHFFVSPSITPLRQWVGPDLGSDHYPIGMDFSFRNPVGDFSPDSG